MPDRILDDWLSAYIDYSKGQESPEYFHLWCGASTIAAALGRRVSIDRAYYNLYPNMYIVLVGESAVSRKSTALRMERDILQSAVPDIPIVATKSTPEALIEFLSTRTEEHGSAEAYIMPSELVVFLGEKDTTRLELLTDLYDCPDTFKYHTRSRGEEICQDVCVNILGATTPDWLVQALPSTAIGGGFTSRIVFVFQEATTKRVAFPYISDTERKLKTHLIEDLKIISKLSGRFDFTEEAKEWYETWYTEVFDPQRADVSLMGYYARKHDTLLKLSMVRTVSHSNTLLIGEGDLESSLKMLNANEKNLPRVMDSVRTTEVGKNIRKVISKIHQEGDMISHSDLLRSLSYCLDADGLEAIIAHLKKAGQVKETVRGRGAYYEIL